MHCFMLERQVAKLKPKNWMKKRGSLSSSVGETKN